MRNPLFFKLPILLLALLASMLDASAYDFEEDGIYYTANRTMATVTYKTTDYNTYSGDVVIPESVNHNGVTYTVTAIDAEAFRSSSGLTSVTVPSTVTEIGMMAFYECDHLTRVDISSIEAWCKISFNYPECYSDDYSPLFSNPLYYARHLFLNGVEVTDLVIPNTIVTLNNYVFCNCEGLSSVTIPQSVRIINGNAFMDCKRLANVDIAPSVTVIGSQAFYGCTDLSSITVPRSVNIIESEAFNSCPGLTGIIVESGNSYYDSRDNCNAIIKTATNTLIAGCQNTVIPNSVTAISGDAFKGCNTLQSIDIPHSVISITGNPFEDCGSLASITVAENNPVYDSRDNCNAIIETAADKLIAGCQNTNIPHTVTSIGDRAFYSCQELKSIEIPNSVISIGKFAFAECSGLTHAIIPNSVETPVQFSGAGWFMGCTNLSHVTIGSSITQMGIIFHRCPNITSVTCLATTPPITEDTWTVWNSGSPERPSNFDLEVYGQATLFVPVTSLEDYKTAKYWKQFSLIRPIGDTDGNGLLGIGDVTELIDFLLTSPGNDIYFGASDVSGDGLVNITDVTELIDILLAP